MNEGGMKSFFLWCVIFILCIMVLVMTVYLANAVSDIGERLGTVSAGLQCKASESSDGFPYRVQYDGETVHIYGSDGGEVYKFALSPYILPDTEKELLSRGMTFSSIDDIWSLVESYTS